MGERPFMLMRRGAALVCCLVAFAVSAGTAGAALEGSLHDFDTGPFPSTSAPFRQNGSCFPCHRPHDSLDTRIWTRSLAEEQLAYDQTTNPDYTPTATLQCYDCHDDAAFADNSPGSVWAIGHEPQDIAFGGTMVGYYETACGEVPGGSNPAPTDGSPTGGHYWKSEPGLTPDFRQGDKIVCSLCHDPHDLLTGSNDAFFRTSTWDGGSMQALTTYGTDLRKSANSRLGTGTGRAMCATCHGYSDEGVQKTFYNVQVPPPPGTVPEHDRDDTLGATACTTCHSHNAIVGCSECHAYPPLLTQAEAGGLFLRGDPQRKYAESYPNGAGAHRRHLDALAAIGSTIFNCALCHGPNPGGPTTAWHNETSGNTCGDVVQANVDIRGMTSYWGSGSSYNGTTSGGDATYAFAAKGGSDGSYGGRCANLTCHGSPPNSSGALNWTDDLVDETTGNPVGDGLSICKWCHDATPARIGTGPWAPNVLGDGATWGADVSGHGKASGAYDANELGDAGGKAAANKSCTTCHDARYTTSALPAANTPLKAHLDNAYESSGSEKRLRATLNGGVGVANTSAACTACHQNAGADAGTQVSTHGNDFAGNAEGAQGSMSRTCRQCHDVHGANWNGSGRNLHMVGKWLDSTGSGTRGTAEAGESAYVDSSAGDATVDITSADAPVVFTRAGAPATASSDDSYDDGFDDNLHESVCVVCHVSLVNNHNQVGDTTLQGFGHNTVGTDCMACHDHDYDNAVATADAFAPSGCNGCHGTNTNETLQAGAVRGQFWPDGDSPLAQYDYADSTPGAHPNHVAAIAAQLFGETTAQLVQDYVAATNPTLSSIEKQKAVCSFCHREPGGGGHSIDDSAAPSGASRVDVLQGGSAGNYFQKYTTGTHATYGRTNYADDTTGSAYNYTTQACTNLVCHNQTTTPATWSTPPVWATVVNTRCSNIECHAPATYTNAHDRHVGAAAKSYECLECHADNNAPTAPVTPVGHGNGKVDMLWSNPASIEGSVGADNGYYDKNDPTYGDTGFGYKSGSYAVSCNLVYCHGGDNAAWGGGNITPTWNNTPAVACGSCHDGNGTGDLSVTATGNHTDHLNAAYGPNFGTGGCLGTATTGCHPNYLVTTTTHVDGSIELSNIDLTSSVLAGTDRCDSCHSTASVTLNTVGAVVGRDLARTPANWANGSYLLPCLSCHNGLDAATVYADGTGTVTAPDMLGTDAANQSGAEVRGHNLASGTYPVSNNVAANRACTDCHSAAVTHINNSNDASYAGRRMIGTVNGGTINGVAPSDATGACNACHATSGTSPATKKNVNMHANTNYALPLEQLFPNPPTTPDMECTYCHEPHGLTSNLGPGFNIYMINPTITVPTPGATAPSAQPIRFEAISGDYSFNDTQGTPDDDLCVVCHAANNMVYNEGGSHAAPGYDNDEEGSDCSGCHLHNLDYPANVNNIATADGFMPVECNACHSYPGKPAGPHPLSPSHDKHVNALPAGKGFTCGACHYQSSHNDTRLDVGDAWAGVTNANTQIRFAAPPSPIVWNPVAAANNQASRLLDSTSFGDSTHVCSDLYCHGDDNAAGRFPAADRGSDTTPDWETAATGACGTCHLYTAASPPGTLAHPKHAGSSASPDPQYSIGCQVCHYKTTNNGTAIVPTNEGMGLHVNTSVEVNFNQLADGRVLEGGAPNGSVYGGDGAIGSGYGDCTNTYCHSNGTNRISPFTAADSAPAVALAWGDTAECWSCHGNGTTNSMPNYTAGTPKANKHDEHVAGNGYGCQVCHWPTTHANGSIDSTVTHVNGSYDANDDGAGATLDAFDYVQASGSCDNANCHGGNDGISWGLAGPITCDLCHSYVNGAQTATDVNNFAWDGAASPTAVQSKVGNATISGEYDTSGHGKVGAPVTCSDTDGCHDSGLPHDLTMSGNNPYRLAGYNFDQTDYCNTTCHAAGSQVRTHTFAEMAAAGTGPKRTWPWSVECVNCHDPHGDQAVASPTGNLSMVQRELYDKEPFALHGAAPAVPSTNTNQDLVFTDNLTGIGPGSYSWDTSASPSYGGVCQECHEDASVLSFHDGTTTVDSVHPVNPGDCSSCHRHDAAFGPAGCEGCHNGDGDNDGTWEGTGYDPDGAGPKAAAPNVMGDGINKDGVGGTPKPFDDGAWGYNVNGHGSNGTAPNTPLDLYGDPYLVGSAECTACHDISVPSGTHLNGTLNSVEQSLNLNANTAHLISAFVAGGISPEYDVQIKFDDTCYARTGCHIASMSHRHAKDADPALKAVRFGDGNTILDGESIRYPVDSDISTNASTAARDYAVCISCHNPHGTDVVESGKTTNRMLRDTWSGEPPTLCNECHR